MKPEILPSLHGCPDCTYKTSSPRKLGRHRSVHHGGIKYKCDRCSFITGYQSNYYRHRKQIHMGGGAVLYQCSKCTYTTSSSEDLTGHIKLSHPEEWICLECGLDFPTADTLESHKRAAHPSAVVEPNNNMSEGEEMEDGDDADWEDSQLHIDLHPNASTELPVMREDLNDSQHLATPKYTRNYGCPDCTFSTRESRDFLHHLRDDHHQKFLIYYCDKCSYASKHLAKVKRHQELIHGGITCATSSTPKRPPTPKMESTKAPNVTVSLSKSFVAGKSALFKPQRRNHSLVETKFITPAPCVPAMEPLYKCHLCKYATDDTQRFRKHERCHQTKAPTTCNLCDFTTVYSWNLDRHLKCHNVRAQYVCRKCSFSQNTRQSMTFHLQHHHTVCVAETAVQTDETEEEVPMKVSIGFEPYIFEQHCVHVNNDYHPGDHMEEMKTPPKPKFTRVECKPASPAIVIPKRIVREPEVIESQPDVGDLEQFAEDPDVKSRTCSICGYQGKWISEMVRHKRVHTNERPFRCKFCNRTSKWKADLIRHVSKIHGVRVISKYTRCKTSEEAIQGEVVFSDAISESGVEEGHNWDESQEDMDDSNTYEVYVGDEPFEGSPAAFPRDLKRSASTEAQSSAAKQLKLEEIQCEICPFHTASEMEMKSHLKSHDKPLGLFNFKCAFCPWFAKRKQLVYQHMLLHCANPNDYMSEVERNVITSATPDVEISKGPILQSLLKPTKVELKETIPEEIKSTGVSALLSDFSAILDAADDDEDCDGPSLNLTAWQQPRFIYNVLPSGDMGEECGGDQLDTPESGSGDEDEVASDIQKVNVSVNGIPFKMWKCRHCPHMSKRRANVRLHEMKHFDTGKKGVDKCPECSYMGDKRSLNEHFKVHCATDISLLPNEPKRKISATVKPAEPQLLVPRNPSSPAVAVAAASSPAPVMVPMTPGQKPKKHECPDCPARFSDRTQLKRHSKFHGTKNKFRCHICSYSVGFAINLRKHFKAHHNIGAFGHIECEDDMVDMDDGENLAVNSPITEEKLLVKEELIDDVKPTISPPPQPQQQPKSRRKSVPVRKVTQMGAENLSFEGAMPFPMGIAV